MTNPNSNYPEAVKTPEEFFNQSCLVLMPKNEMTSRYYLVDSWNDLGLFIAVNDPDKGIGLPVIDEDLNMHNFIASEVKEDFKNLMRLYENGRNIFVPKAISMQSAMFAMVLGQSFDEIEDTHEESKCRFMILTGNRLQYGATAILYARERLLQIRDEWDSDIYVLPSIHEMLLIPTSDCQLKDLKDMVSGINGDENVIEKSDVLSDTVYIFDKFGNISKANH